MDLPYAKNFSFYHVTRNGCRKIRGYSFGRQMTSSIFCLISCGFTIRIGYHIASGTNSAFSRWGGFSSAEIFCKVLSVESVAIPVISLSTILWDTPFGGVMIVHCILVVSISVLEYLVVSAALVKEKAQQLVGGNILSRFILHYQLLCTTKSPKHCNESLSQGPRTKYYKGRLLPPVIFKISDRKLKN